MKKILLVIIAMLCIPNAVKAAEMSDDFKAILNDKKQFIANTVAPTSDYELEILVNEYLLIEKGLGAYNISNCNSSYTICELTYWKDADNSETHNIEVVYKYDKSIKTQINGYMSKIPAGKKEFYVRDLEIINFWLNGRGASKYITDYSSELKDYFDYKNFSIDVKRGTTSPFSTSRSGMANFKYNNVVYGLITDFTITADHIIYVPSSTENTPQAILEAAQDRFDEYVGVERTELTYISNARDYFINEIGNTLEDYDTFEDAFYYEFGMENVSETDLIFTVDVFYDENSGNTHSLIIRRDSDKMITPSYKTSDVSTNITISTDNSDVPLDAMVSANKLTSGTEYNNIMKKLQLTDHITYDLKLYSNSIEEYVTKLENGMFEVKIPIPSNLENETLTAYYVTENGDTETYEVTPKDGYAIFYTNHFSIYTLGYVDEVVIDFTKGKSITELELTDLQNKIGAFLIEKGVIIGATDQETNYSYFKSANGKLLLTVKPSGEIVLEKGITTDDNISYTFSESERAELEAQGINVKNAKVIVSNVKPNNPDTSDDIINSMFILGISLIGLIGMLYLTKKNKGLSN